MKQSDRIEDMTHQDRTEYMFKYLIGLEDYNRRGLDLDLEALLHKNQLNTKSVYPDMFNLESNKTRFEQIRSRFRVAVAPVFITKIPANPVGLGKNSNQEHVEFTFFPAEVYSGDHEESASHISDNHYGMIRHSKMDVRPKSLLHHGDTFHSEVDRLVELIHQQTCGPKHNISWMLRNIPISNVSFSLEYTPIEIKRKPSILNRFIGKTKIVQMQTIKVVPRDKLNVSARKPRCMIYKHTPGFTTINEFYDRQIQQQQINGLMVVGGFEYHEFDYKHGVAYPELAYKTALAVCSID